MLARILLGASRGGGAYTPEPPEPEDPDRVRGTSVKRTTNWGTAADNDTVPFDSEEYDDDDIWDVSNPNVLGPMPASYDGKRAVFYAGAIWSASTINYRELKIFKNGDTANPIAVEQVGAPNGNAGLQLVSRPYVLATGDEFELCARTGEATNALAADDYSIRFAIEVRGV